MQEEYIYLNINIVLGGYTYYSIKAGILPLIKKLKIGIV